MRPEYLLDRLDDDLDFMVSLNFASQLLTDALSKSRRELSQSFTEWEPAGRKYWTVPQEIKHEELGHLAGLAFVLAQVALTQTISIVKAIRDASTRELSLPKDKSALLNTLASVDSQTGLSLPLIIDTAANYFKHHQEWGTDWDSKTGSKQQQYTAKIAKQCGMSPGWPADNLLHVLGLFDDDPTIITRAISDWRHSLARQMYKDLGIPDPTLVNPE